VAGRLMQGAFRNEVLTFDIGIEETKLRETLDADSLSITRI
jgi:hypothetical protein